MKNFSFFFDFDDTLIPTKHLVVKYMNSTYNINTNTGDWVDNDNYDSVIKKFKPDSCVIPDEIYLNFGRDFFPFFSLEEFSLFDGAREAIEEMHEKYNLYVVTSRQGKEKNHIKKILKNQGVLDLFEYVHCVYNWENNKFISQPKAEFIKSIPGVKIGFLDDSLSEVTKSIGSVLCPLLFDPHGKHTKEVGRLEIVSCWKQVKREFAERKIRW